MSTACPSPVCPKPSFFGTPCPTAAGARPSEMIEQSRSSAAVLFKSIVELSVRIVLQLTSASRGLHARRAPLEYLVGDHADEDDRAHHGEVQRTGYPEQVDEILQDLQERRPDEDADNRTFAAAETTAAQNRRR